ncbi:hypothetical protein [Roseomonas sp. WA12]
MTQLTPGRLWVGFYGLVIVAIVISSLVKDPRSFMLICDGESSTTANVSVQESRWPFVGPSYGFIPRQGSPMPRPAAIVLDDKDELRLIFRASPAELVRDGGVLTQAIMEFQLNRRTREFQLSSPSARSNRGSCDRYVGGLRSSWPW